MLDLAPFLCVAVDFSLGTGHLIRIRVWDFGWRIALHWFLTMEQREKIQILHLYRVSIGIAAMYMLNSNLQNNNNQLFFLCSEDFLSF